MEPKNLSQGAILISYNSDGLRLSLVGTVVTRYFCNPAASLVTIRHSRQDSVSPQPRSVRGLPVATDRFDHRIRRHRRTVNGPRSHHCRALGELGAALMGPLDRIRQLVRQRVRQPQRG